MGVIDLTERNNNKLKRNGGTPERPKEPFKKIARHTGPSSFAAGFLLGNYARKPDKSELKAFDEQKKEIRDSKLPDKEKKRLLELHSSAKRDDMWDMDETSKIIANYITGAFTKELADYRIKALEAWRKGKIKEFAKKELEGIESKKIDEKLKSALKKMLAVGSNRTDLVAALAVRNLINYLFSKGKVEDKVKDIEELTESLTLV